jgi:hypothetical protein
MTSPNTTCVCCRYFYVMQGERTLPEKIHPAMFAAMQVNPRDFEGQGH